MSVYSHVNETQIGVDCIHRVHPIIFHQKSPLRSANWRVRRRNLVIGQEKDVLLGVTNARARVGSIQATPELINDPEAFAKFQSAQGELSSALSRLLVVAENYPQLKSDANFRELQAQLEGTENRITIARNRYIKAVQDYNVVVRSFPSNLTAMVFGFKVKPSFAVENEKEISTAPKVDFSRP